ncbi:DUF4396 domain-containing protein [Maritimibacter sp. 55A14]|uniref:DUF4396 domain-containing protein n=1 Tax=Maritimibacter sp. 55A14 TaxID=2174844 RepID=UPI001304B17B|nr:DUF4396 domain-containing protein [Maritimibacter sp. 55A14]
MEHDTEQGGMFGTALHATLHCTLGCVIGELAGLAIGISLGLGAWLSMGLATALAFVTGLSLATVPLARRRSIPLRRAFRMIWLGEATSIAAMELAMNAADYLLGGASVTSIFVPLFWWSLLAAIPVGFAAALPVNYMMIRRGLGHHNH